MKKYFASPLIGTIIIFFVSLAVVAPILEKMGYSSVEGSYHSLTHALLISLIFIVIVCTIIIIEEINDNKQKDNDEIE